MLVEANQHVPIHHIATADGAHPPVTASLIVTKKRKVKVGGGEGILVELVLNAPLLLQLLHLLMG